MAQQPLPLHSLLALISNSPSFYPRFYAMQYLSQLLTSRPTVAQAYVMSAPSPGVDGILAVLDSRAPPPQTANQANVAQPSTLGGGAGEMLRNEALLLLPAMLAGNADLQKIVAFSGAFEKLFEIINQEGGIEGGIVVQDTLTVVACLLRFNVSNQVSDFHGSRDVLNPCRIILGNCLSFLPSLRFLAFPRLSLRKCPHPTISLCSSGRNRRFIMPDWS